VREQGEERDDVCDVVDRRILGKMDDAIKAFERAVQNGDSEGLAICQLSELYIETGRVMDGIQMLECNVEHVMQVAPQHLSTARRCLAHAPLQNEELPSSQNLQCMMRLATLYATSFMLVPTAAPRPRFTPCSYGKDGLWLKVLPLCEKVNRFILPLHPTHFPLHSDSGVRVCIRSRSRYRGGRRQVQGRRYGVAARGWPCFICCIFAVPFRLTPRAAFPFVVWLLWLLGVWCVLLFYVFAQNSHDCSLSIQARMATGRGSGGGLDESICEDDI
jgi:hypothetical protein